MQDGYLKYSSIGDGGRFLLDVGFELENRRLGRDRERLVTEERRYLQGIHSDWVGSRLDCP